MSLCAGRLAVVVLLAVACTGDDAEVHTVLVGECAPPAGATAITTAVLHPASTCLDSVAGDLAVIDDVAGWDALFPCATPVPPELDFATHRAAVVAVRCSPIDARFVTATPAEIVIGIDQRVSGACITTPLVVPLPRTAQPVRLARCQATCAGDCPPVP
ncbi:MAG: hypothetical protein R3B06_26950 [Kofleriaceae bacterium]